MNNTMQLYIDEKKEIKGYPITSPDRVIDENGVSIKEQLDNIETKNNYFINALSYGIKESIDNSSIIKNCIKNIQRGGKLIVPNGTYNVSTKIVWDGTMEGFPSWQDNSKGEKSFIIEGSGKGTVLKAINNYIFDFSYSTIQNKNPFKEILIQNLTLDLNNQSFGIIAKNCSLITFKNVTFKNIKITSISEFSSYIHLIACGGYKIDNCKFENDVTSYSNSITLENNTSDGHITNCDISCGGVGINIMDCGMPFINNNIIFGQLISSIKIINKTLSYSGGVISNNEIEANGSGSAINICDDEQNTQPYIGININNNSIYVFNNANGIVLGNTSNEIVSNNIFLPSGGGVGYNKNAILVKNSSNGMIMNNIIRKIEVGGTGIRIENMSNGLIKSNLLTNMENHEYCKFIHLINGTNLTIDSNICNTNTTLGYWIYTEKLIPLLILINNIKSTEKENIIKDKYTTEKSLDTIHYADGINIRNCSWNDSPLILGSMYIWLDSSYDIRVKVGKPSNDIDGMKVSFIS